MLRMTAPPHVLAEDVAALDDTPETRRIAKRFNGTADEIAAHEGDPR